MVDGPTTGPLADDATLADRVLDGVSSERRRLTLQYLMDEPAGSPGGSGVTRRELSEHVAAWQYGYDDTDAVERTERQTVYVTLHQTHLPKLDAYDIINYPDGNDPITLRDSETANLAIGVLAYIRDNLGDDADSDPEAHPESESWPPSGPGSVVYRVRSFIGGVTGVGGGGR